MKDKKYIVIGLVLAALFGLALFFYMRQDEDRAIGQLAFRTADLNGNAVDESVFEGYDLTMVNVWGTYCAPCIEEMPDLEELYQELQAENVNLMGVVSDLSYPTGDEDIYEEAQRIVEETGSTYQHILADQMLQSKLLNRTTGVPATVFVDREGNVVGDIIVGARSKLEYRDAVQKILEGLGHDAG